jgi:DivIVA domain-containing protein
MGTVDRDFLPLGSSFDVTRRGYDRRQVDEHLDRLDADLRILAADRDAAVARAAELAKRLDDQRNQLLAKEQEIARLASAPSSIEGMSRS